MMEECLDKAENPVTGPKPSFGLEEQGMHHLGPVHWNLQMPFLYEHAVRRREGEIGLGGAFVVNTGHHTGRSPRDKYIVDEPGTHETVNWGSVNQQITPAQFASLHQRVLAYLQGQELFVQDLYAGADPEYRLPVRVVSPSAWHSLFARNMFLRPTHTELKSFRPDFTIIHLPYFEATPALDKLHSEVFILVNFAERLVLIGGTRYAGEIKKSVFGLLNFLLPPRDVLPMHGSVNVGPKGDSAVFFGLSGTGKTTLSADGTRTLVGDDEHGWSPKGLFNFEGGCYAKVIRLSPEAEPEIYATVGRFGTVLENVVADAYGRLDLTDQSLTENTRSAYPVEYIPNIEPSLCGGQPRNVVMLTCDAFGVMPPIAKLTPAQAMYHFLSGYTALVAGTEKGLGAEPQATFSTCFGAPFLPRRPEVYGRMLTELMARHGADCWLVNTGWSGGQYGVGQRMGIKHTRALLRAALDGSLARTRFRKERFFGLSIPEQVPGVPTEVLDPREAWSDKAAYDRMAKELVARFEKNFSAFEAEVGDEVRAAAIRAAA